MAISSTLKWRLVLALVIVFCAGVAVGVLGAAHHARREFFARHSLHFGDRMREHLRRELNLTPEQYDKVAPIIDEMSNRLEAIRGETRQKVAETMGESRNQIAPLLTPEQRDKLDQMKRRHERMLHFRGIHSGMHDKR